MAGIEIFVTAGTTAGTSSVSASGSIQHVITDAEVQSFGVTDAALKSAVNKYFGKSPDDAFLHSSTPWGDLYTTYHWPQVQATLSVVSATITGLSSDPTIVTTQHFENDSSSEGNFNVSITQSVQNTSSSTWTTSATVTVSQEINYSVGVPGDQVGGKTTFSFGMTFGQSGTTAETVTLGSTAGVVVDLKPHQSVDAQLTASKGTLHIRIVYQASLSGVVAVNYGSPYKGHHFYALPIESVMGAGGLNNSQQFTQDMTIGFFANSNVKLTDPTSGTALQALAARSATAPALKAMLK